MKAFKKILALIFIGLLMFSCSSDDDEITSGTDEVSLENLEKILGTWRFGARTINGAEVEIEDECEFLFSVEFLPTIAIVVEWSGVNCSESRGSQESYGINVNTLTVGDSVFEIIFLDDNLLIVEFSEGNDIIQELYVKL